MYLCVVLCIVCVVLCIVFCVVLGIVCVYICVLYYCHRVATQLQFNISYHIISCHIISYHIPFTLIDEAVCHTVAQCLLATSLAL